MTTTTAPATNTPIFDEVAEHHPLPDPVDAEFHWVVRSQPVMSTPRPGARPVRKRKARR